jgi:FtsP/CotA-like multicopper oxidase with cupredoxin domain
VQAGTTIRIRVHNTLGHRITFFLPTSQATDDSVVLAPGDVKEISTQAARPGNYIYRAADSTKAAAQFRMDGALGGAIVVDTAGKAPPKDRVFMIMMVPDSLLLADIERGATLASAKGRISYTINGRSWPNTERISTTVGDTLHWRVINGSDDIHPMHLHGFYYRVDDMSGLLVGRQGQGAPGRIVVTERLSQYSAMSMTWVPERPGNWIFHCHFALHLMPPDADSADAKPMDHDNPALNGMVGLALGLEVAPRRGAPAVAESRPARRIRLVAVRDSEFPDSAPQMRFEIEEKGHRTMSRASFSPTLYLTKNEPVSIMVVNHMREKTAVHWHGLEIDSYYDGVAGLSGTPSRLAPVIAPGDSFEARLTPPRAGTFMYHSHLDDVRQQTAGLVGPLVVQDGPLGLRPDEHEIFLKGSRAIGAGAASPLEVNGMANPDTIVIHAGRQAVFRFMSLSLVNPNATVSLTARSDSAYVGVPDGIVEWQPIAKDGADLPPAARAPRLARQIIAMGETYDFSYTPTRPGQMRIEVRSAGARGVLLARVPVRVE